MGHQDLRITVQTLLPPNVDHQKPTSARATEKACRALIAQDQVHMKANTHQQHHPTLWVTRDKTNKTSVLLDQELMKKRQVT